MFKEGRRDLEIQLRTLYVPSQCKPNKHLIENAGIPTKITNTESTLSAPGPYLHSYKNIFGEGRHRKASVDRNSVIGPTAPRGYYSASPPGLSE